MTEEQIKACEKLNKGSGFPAKPYFLQGFQAAQDPEMLMLNPLVKGLVEALEIIINKTTVNDTSANHNYKKYAMEALAQFKEGE